MVCDGGKVDVATAPSSARVRPRLRGRDLFDAVIFDCDGCLIDTEVACIDVEIQALSELGLIYDREEFVHRFIGGGTQTWLAQIDADCRAKLGAPLPDGFYDDLVRRVRAAHETSLSVVAGAADAVPRLPAMKAVASSSSDEHLRLVLGRAGLWDLFAPHVYSAHACENAKPAPDVYLYAAARLSCDPGRCLAIEDSANGVRAAHAAGMQVWGFVGGGHLTLADGQRLLDAGANRIIADWAEAQMAFSAWNRSAG